MEGVQQGDPIGPLLFCLTIHRMITQLQTAFNVWFLDDEAIGGNVLELNRALTTIEQECEQFGLYLNVNKCELVCPSLSDMASLLDAFPDLKVVDSASANLLGSPLGNMPASNVRLESKIYQLRLISNHVCYLDSHDALILLKPALALP